MRESNQPPPAEPSPSWRAPWVQLKTFSFHPSIYPAMILRSSQGIAPGTLVAVYDRSDRPFGAGLWNPRARVPLRVLYHGDEAFQEAQLIQIIDRAIDLRLGALDLPSVTDAFRVVNSDGDGLSGLIIDRFGPLLSIQVHSLGIAQRLRGWLPRIHERLGTKEAVVTVDPGIARLEGITPSTVPPSDRTYPIKIKEHGVRFEVDLENGHKTGFFCDQRENRRRLTKYTADKRVVDLCCYTGGFALAAKVMGKAAEVTGVDLDETAIAQAKRNANINTARVDWVHCDAYSYARQLRKNGEKFGVVILDPPKFVFTVDDEAEGFTRYEDLNSLGVVITEPGGLLVTCSCSGRVSAHDFEQLVIRSAHRVGRRLQFLEQTGAAEDHPVMSNCLESRYLKVLWARVW
jgi:23S rRNA (cytosine1962-C5)-methyltransferase